MLDLFPKWFLSRQGQRTLSPSSRKQAWLQTVLSAPGRWVGPSRSPVSWWNLCGPCSACRTPCCCRSASLLWRTTSDNPAKKQNNKISQVQQSLFFKYIETQEHNKPPRCSQETTSAFVNRTSNNNNNNSLICFHTLRCSCLMSDRPAGSTCWWRPEAATGT